MPFTQSKHTEHTRSRRVLFGECSLFERCLTKKVKDFRRLEARRARPHPTLRSRPRAPAPRRVTEEDCLAGRALCRPHLPPPPQQPPHRSRLPPPAPVPPPSPTPTPFASSPEGEARPRARPPTPNAGTPTDPQHRPSLRPRHPHTAPTGDLPAGEAYNAARGRHSAHTTPHPPPSPPPLPHRPPTTPHLCHGAAPPRQPHPTAPPHRVRSSPPSLPLYHPAI